MEKLMKLVVNNKGRDFCIKVVTKAINHSVPKIKNTIYQERNIVEGIINQRC